MTTESDILAKIGDGAVADTVFTEAIENAAILRAESIVNCTARFNFSDAYAALNADVKYILSDIVSSLVAIEWISYDMGGYTSRTEAEDMLNFLRDGVLRGLSLIRDKKTQDFINGA